MLPREGGVIASIAGLLGATEPSIALLASILAGLPLAVIYRNVFYGKNTNLQNLYFTVCGLYIAYFNFGPDAVHSLANIVLIYILLLLAGGTRASVAAAFILNMGYLLYGYLIFTSHKDGTIYAITWCTPHCVISLRLTGLVFDVYDGTKKKEKLSADQKETALVQVPSFLEICGFTYFFGAFLTGPQFSMKRYLDFIGGHFSNHNELPDSLVPGFKRALLGGICIAVYQASELFISSNFMVTEEYAAWQLWWKLGYLMVWGKLQLYKYVGVWLLAEGACTVAGLTYNGVDEKGRARWNGCANVRLLKFETAQTFQEMIDSFNVNTNAWMAKYVYKRLRFLGSKSLSQCLTLLYLSVWHGIHPGYFNNFMLEFFIMNMEQDVTRLVYGSPMLSKVCKNPSVKPVLFVLKKAYMHTFIAYPLSSFVLLTADRSWKMYSSIHFIGHIMFVGWPLVSFLISLTMTKRKKAVNGVQNGQNGHTVHDKPLKVD